MQLTDWLIARNKKKRERAAQRTQTRAERLKPVEESLTRMIEALREQSARREQEIAALQARVSPGGYQGPVDGMPGKLTREEILKRQRAAVAAYPGLAATMGPVEAAARTGEAMRGHIPPLVIYDEVQPDPEKTFNPYGEGIN